MSRRLHTDLISSSRRSHFASPTPSLGDSVDFNWVSPRCHFEFDSMPTRCPLNVTSVSLQVVRLDTFECDVREVSFALSFSFGASLETFFRYLPLGISHLEKLASEAGRTAVRIMVSLCGVPDVGWYWT